MMVLIIENAPNRLRGRLSLWMFELKPGVYLIDCNSRLRDWIWETVCQNIGKGSAMMAWSTSMREFGFDIKTIGDTKRVVSNIDGIKMLSKVD